MSSSIPNPKWRKTSKIINTRTITISRSIFFFVFFSRTNRKSNISVYYTLCKHFSNSECWRSVRGKLYEPRQKPGLSPWKICLFEEKSGYASVWVWVWVSHLKRFHGLFYSLWKGTACSNCSFHLQYILERKWDFTRSRIRAISNISTDIYLETDWKL